ncbi:MAG: ribosomal protein S18-alanine N-acetyltransferase [bacterium]|nr:ribosomal protein S18-alanine N-acetyltransferase [bacterium]
MAPESRSPVSRALQIRPMGTADLDQVVVIEGNSFNHPWSREQFQAELSRSHVSRCYVAEFANGDHGGGGPEGPRIAGFVTAWLVADEIHITDVAVHPDMRGRGVARVLLEHVLEEVRSHGGRWCQLEVRVGNTAARGLYGKLGFETLGGRRGYYSDGEDAVVMGKELDLQSSSGV